MFVNCFSNPTSLKKTLKTFKKTGKQSTVDCTLQPIQRPSGKHIVGKVIVMYVSWAGRKHLVNRDVLHIDTSKSNG